MSKKIDRTMLISTIFCMLPMIILSAFYSTLPEKIAIHWDFYGNPNNFIPKKFAVFVLPLFLSAINIFVHFSIDNDPKRINTPQIIKTLGKWTIPFMSVVTAILTIYSSKITNVNISSVVGVLIIIVGNYFPKCKRNYTIGIKLPWTLASEEIWNKTHRFAGYIWVLGGVLIILNTIFPIGSISFVSLTLLIVIPILYSIILYYKECNINAK